MKSPTSIIERPINGWLSQTAGPVRYLWCRNLGYPDPRWWVFGAALARAPFGTYLSPTDFAAAGASINRMEAMIRTIGEVLERHAAMHAINEDREVPARFDETRFVDRFPKCAEAESCPPMFKGRNRDVPVGHVAMKVAASGEDALVPTPYVHLGYLAASSDLLATYPISTGTAFGPNRYGAQWRALCEVAERDAIMLFWLTRRRFRRILVPPATNPRHLLSRIERIRDVELDCCLLDITTDFRVPTALAILSGHEYPHTTVGASCQADPVRACCKAIDEAVSVRYGLHHDRWRRTIPSYSDFNWVRRLEDHMALYGSWVEPPSMSFIWDAPSVTLGEFAAEFDGWAPRSDAEFLKLARILRAELNFTVLTSELICPDTEEYGHVMKVVVPEMVPLSQDHNARWTETERLKRRIQDAQDGINEFPHPFA